MARWFAVLLIVVAALVGALWYWVHLPQQQALVAAQAQNARLQAEATRQGARLRALEAQVADLEALRDTLQRSGTDLQQQVQAREAELAAMRTTQDDLVSGLREEIAAKQIQVESFRDQLRVDVVDELLFASGEAELKQGGKEVLRRVGGALEKAGGRSIQVQGHTDDIPIQGALARRYPTNWELSAARAVNVARFLQEVGVAPERLSASARSQYDPRVPNDSEQARRQNRRIEILLGPRPKGDAAAPVPTRR
jgi:chemotaxis protein MotB